MTETNLLTLDELAAQIAQHAENLSRKSEELKEGEHEPLIRHFDGVRVAFDKISDAKKHLDVVVDRLSREYIPEASRRYTERTGVKPPYNVEGVGRVSIAHRYSCSMLDKQAGIDWLKANDMADIVQETVNSSTLAAFAKNRVIEEGKDLPPDIFKVGTVPYTSITKK